MACNVLLVTRNNLAHRSVAESVGDVNNYMKKVKEMEHELARIRGVHPVKDVSPSLLYNPCGNYTEIDYSAYHGIWSGKTFSRTRRIHYGTDYQDLRVERGDGQDRDRGESSCEGGCKLVEGKGKAGGTGT